MSPPMRLIKLSSQEKKLIYQFIIFFIWHAKKRKCFVYLLLQYYCKEIAYLVRKKYGFWSYLFLLLQQGPKTTVENCWYCEWPKILTCSSLEIVVYKRTRARILIWGAPGYFPKIAIFIFLSLGGIALP